MTFLEKLDLLMETEGINKRKLAIRSGVPYTTIDGFYKKGYENAQISTIRKIAKAFGCSLDYLIETEEDIKEQPTEDGELSEKELGLIRSIGKLDQSDRELAADLCSALVLELLRHRTIVVEESAAVPAGTNH